MIKKIIKKIIKKSRSHLFNLRGFIPYFGYKLYFSKETSVVKRFIQSGEYEAPEQKCISLYLNSIKGDRIMIDVGANIGMMSLAAISTVKNLKIYAFEPGPHQNRYFKKTIKYNKLHDIIKLFKLGLDNKTGTCEFAVHNFRDVSGDGFVDTGRAGDTEVIEVQTITMDEWWINEKCPYVNLIKIDVEGAELRVISGASKLLKECTPLVIFEVHTDNLKNYPYTLSDLLQKWNEFEYDIFNLDLSTVTARQWELMNGDGSYGIDLVAMKRTNGNS